MGAEAVSDISVVLSWAAPTVSLMHILLLASLLQSPLPFASGFQETIATTTTTAISSLHLFRTSGKSTASLSLSRIAPELSSERKAYAVGILDRIFGKESSGSWDKRREAARSTTLDRKDGDDDANNETAILQGIPEHELVYGELGIEALATILDAVGVKKGDVFLDIGSGDGLLVVGAALLFPGYLNAARGIEIVPELYDRSLAFRDKFSDMRLREEEQQEFPEVSFRLGNIYELSNCKSEADYYTRDATLAVCFATTWSKNIPGKKLDRLSRVLGKGGPSELPVGAKVVIIDGVLEPGRDGYDYEGELKLHCPDTAPYSVARLYTRI